MAGTTIIRQVVNEKGEVLSEEIIEKGSTFMSTRAAARYFGVSEWTVHQWAVKGLIQKYYIPQTHTVRVKRDEIENLFKPGRVHQRRPGVKSLPVITPQTVEAPTPK